MRKVAKGSNVIKGTDEFDFLSGTPNDDAIKGGDGGDILVGDAQISIGLLEGGDDVLLGGDGNDALFGDLIGGSPELVVLGGNDTLYGGDGDDILFGDGNIGFSPASQGGDDLLRGGDGFDLFQFNGRFGDDIVEDFTQGEDRLGFYGNQFTNLTIEALQISLMNGDTVITVASEGTFGTVTLAGFSGTLNAVDLLSM